MASFLPYYTTVGRLAVEVHPDRKSLGLAAARSVAAYLSDVIARQGEARVIFACAPSQDDFLAALVDEHMCDRFVDWRSVTAFHMDDYVGLPTDHAQSFRHYLSKHLLKRVPIGAFHPLLADADDTETVCRYYSELLCEKPIDLICLGIGENGHIAFNDPQVANFDDRSLVKVVRLDAACRQQQVNDGCFQSLEDVPLHALTLTVPVFRRARRLSIQVPGLRKAAAVRATLRDKISPACPASILRLHPDAILYLDKPSSASLRLN